MKFVKVQQVSFQHPGLEMRQRNINTRYIVEYFGDEDGTYVKLLNYKDCIEIKETPEEFEAMLRLATEF